MGEKDESSKRGPREVSKPLEGIAKAVAVLDREPNFRVCGRGDCCSCVNSGGKCNTEWH